MPSDSWMVPGISATTPVEEAARLAFATRFAAVDLAWVNALAQPNDPEHVHQLRVTSRRAAAALRVFDRALPDRLQSKLAKTLRSLRQSAGTARDEDVLVIRAQEWMTHCDENERPGLDWLLGTFANRRAKAHEAIRKTDSLRDKWTSLIHNLNIQVPEDRTTLVHLAGRQIPKLLAKFETAACADIESPAQLHELRITGKRLRYSLELLSTGLPGAGAFRPRAAERSRHSRSGARRADHRGSPGEATGSA